MADIAKRQNTNVLIDRDSISIKVDGRVNGTKAGQKVRSSSANPNDGFVYTSKTKRIGEGENAEFFYVFGKDEIDMGNNIDKLKEWNPNDPDGMFRSVNQYRDNENFEGKINFKKQKGIINGDVTPENSFIYNEGNALINSQTNKDHSIDGEDTLDSLNTEVGGGYVKGTISFYNQFADQWTPELTKVRKL